MTATRFLLLALLALPLAGCKGVPDLLSLIVDKPDNRTPDPNDSHDPYGLLDRSTVPDNHAEPIDVYDPYGFTGGNR